MEMVKLVPPSVSVEIEEFLAIGCTKLLIDVTEKLDAPTVAQTLIADLGVVEEYLRKVESGSQIDSELNADMIEVMGALSKLFAKLINVDNGKNGLTLN